MELLIFSHLQKTIIKLKIMFKVSAALFSHNKFAMGHRTWTLSLIFSTSVFYAGSYFWFSFNPGNTWVQVVQVHRKKSLFFSIHPSDNWTSLMQVSMYNYILTLVTQGTVLWVLCWLVEYCVTLQKNVTLTL